MTCLLQPNSGIQDGISIRLKQDFDFVKVLNSAAIQFTLYAYYFDQVELLFTRTATQSCTVQPRTKKFIPPTTVLPTATSSHLVLDISQQLMECQTNVSSTCRLASELDFCDSSRESSLTPDNSSLVGSTL